MDRHLKIVGSLYIAVGLCGLLGGGFMLASMVGGGLATGDGFLMFLVPAMGVALTMLVLLFSVPTLIGGFALLARKPWARRFGLLVAALNIVNFPLGTPVGAYGLWALSKP